MASIDKRPARSAGGEVSYRVRYRDPAGIQRSKTFPTRARARQFSSTVDADKARGSYVDQALGRMTLAAYAEQWLAVQTYGESTREATIHRVNRHIAPSLGGPPLADLRPSQIQSWVRSKQQELAPGTVRLLFSLLSSILNGAVDDDRIAKNPCRAGSIRLPRLNDRRIVPWTDRQVVALRRSLPDRYAVMLAITTGLGCVRARSSGWPSRTSTS